MDILPLSSARLIISRVPMDDLEEINRILDIELREAYTASECEDALSACSQLENQL